MKDQIGQSDISPNLSRALALAEGSLEVKLPTVRQYGQTEKQRW